MRRTILWATELSPAHGLRHGGTLRMAHLARALMAMGHEVHALLWEVEGTDAAPHAAFLHSLIAEGFIAGAFTIPRPTDKHAGRRATTERLREIFRRSEAHAVIVGARPFLPVLAPAVDAPPLVIDWCDSEVLARWRDLVPFDVATFLRKCRSIVHAAREERAFTRRAAACIAASRVDKRCLDLVTAQARKVVVIGNGVGAPTRQEGPKVPGRLVFTGNMDFPPNYKAVLWFLDHVLPVLVAARPDVSLVIAGQNPVPELLARASDHVRVLGFVDDMREVIASGSLFVAPMISGSGFKNKVLEAVASGTFVASTPMGVEFLDEALRQELIVAASPRALAAEILAYLEAPEAYGDRLARATAIVRRAYTWEAQAHRLAELLETVTRR